MRVNTDEDKRPGNVGKQKLLKRTRKLVVTTPVLVVAGKYKKCCFLNMAKIVSLWVY